MCTERSTLMDIYVNTSRHPGTQRFLQCQLGVLWPQHKVNNLQKYLLPNKMAMVKILIISYDIMMIYHIINIILQCHPGTQRFLLCQLDFLWPQLLPIITENPRLAKNWFCRKWQCWKCKFPIIGSFGLFPCSQLPHNITNILGSFWNSFFYQTWEFGPRRGWGSSRLVLIPNFNQKTILKAPLLPIHSG